ncbi:hypothetical protein HN51_053319 [Arachis hypogaea]|uniref:UPF0481 protein n=1 Tax=Arachis hypogaea TaxID=3818 RepID=A0A6B9V344_ARAHY|nr:UPF0481 protein At3g47200-like [Arachis ipaensis]XP_025675633.1 UPF0481 protein At3g47200-like [Arachis hypogaea]QHN75649.1 UPF0481 protein [Arachis hypogaea]
MDTEEEHVVPPWLEQNWERLEEVRKKLTGGAVNKGSRPKIQKIPLYMAERMEFRRYYEPQLISFGLYHLSKQQLLQGKPYKDLWTAMYLQHTNQRVRDLHFRILRHDWRPLYQYVELSRDSDTRETISVYGNPRSKDDFVAGVLVLDGCSVLELLEKSDCSVDSEQELKISIDKLVRVHQDLLVMDNQIPFQVLRLLCQDEARLQKCLENFLRVHGIETTPKLGKGKLCFGMEKENNGTQSGQQEAQEIEVIVQGDDQQDKDEDKDEPIHLLDYLRKALLMRDCNTIHKEIVIKIKRRSLHLRKYRIGTIRELKAAGIHVRKLSNNDSVFPSFKDGMLQLPELIVDGSTAHIFLNLVAYEMCPDFRNHFEISSFLVFMSSLIDQPEDVKELRLAGIIINELASDKEVADLFNKMDSILVPETPLFAHVRDQIHSHFESKRGRITMLSWMGEASNTFFRSPWTIIALLAATLGLVLTFIQTWFAIHPKAS